MCDDVRSEADILAVRYPALQDTPKAWQGDLVRRMTQGERNGDPFREELNGYLDMSLRAAQRDIPVQIPVLLLKGISRPDIGRFTLS